MRIRLFQGSRIEDLEKEVNHFLNGLARRRYKPELYDIKLSSTPSTPDHEPYETVMVVYE